MSAKVVTPQHWKHWNHWQVPEGKQPDLIDWAYWVFFHSPRDWRA
jgi:hypothetical protein